VPLRIADRYDAPARRGPHGVPVDAGCVIGEPVDRGLPGVDGRAGRRRIQPIRSRRDQRGARMLEAANPVGNLLGRASMRENAHR